MTSGQRNGSEGIRDGYGTDILDLAREFDIHPSRLETALDEAAALLRASRERVRPASKRALRGLAKTLAKAIDHLSTDEVRARLIEAVFEEPDGPDEDGLACYTAWRGAQVRVDDVIEGARDLLALVRAGEAFKGAAGRPRYDHWTVAIGSLLDFWIRDLGREVTISGHPDDGRNVKPSLAVRFIHQCMQSLDKKITEQACRTILQNLQDRDVTNPELAP